MVIVQNLKWCNLMQYRKEIKINSKNTLTTYSPVRSKDENKEIDWQSIVGLFLSDVCNKDFNINGIDEFRSECKLSFDGSFERINDFDLVEKIYFSTDDIYKISPDFLILKSKSSHIEQNNLRIADMYFNLLGSEIDFNFGDAKVNFLEKEIIRILNEKRIKKHEKYNVKEEPYLPYLSEKFKEDLIFLSKNSKYFIANIENFLKLYGFLYSSQLALNLYFTFEEPKNQELYFILENEKASGERSCLKNSGYSLFYRRIQKVFPLLSINEQIQNQFETTKPFWKLFQELDDNEENIKILKDFLEKFTIEKKFEFDAKKYNDSNLKGILEGILNIAEKQFSDKFPVENESRIPVNSRIVSTYVKKLCKDFIKYRGSAGATLVINFDFFLLLTNLCIADREKLRLNELLVEMQSRGVYFDKKSHSEIISFYERVGNIERMSDSGDAIYVKKTI